MKKSQNYVSNGNQVNQSTYYTNRLEDVIRKGCTKKELGMLLVDLDMDEGVGGKWFYVHPADKFLFKTMKENDCLTVPVVCKDGTTGSMDIYSVDVSYGDEGRVRIGVDNLFELEFNFDQDKCMNSKWVEVRVVSSEIEEPCCYDGGKIYLDPQMCLLIQDLIQDNM